ncbi:MAG: hypothetical protein JSW17_03475 [Candidatus Omnitrophota bacterium]|nr:MAG: hypothetical protein JSW17_03475 [Candidatus Omnitrophota bacterium]
MILTHKAYSFATWTITFAVLFAALAIIRTPLKRGIAKKVKGTTDYLLWGQFGDEAGQHSRDPTMMSKSKATSTTQTDITHEAGVTTTKIESPEAKSTRISAGVGSGAESALKLIEDTYESTDLGTVHSDEGRSLK